MSTADLNDSLRGNKRIRYENIERILRALIEPKGNISLKLFFYTNCLAFLNELQDMHTAQQKARRFEKSGRKREFFPGIFPREKLEEHSKIEEDLMVPYSRMCEDNDEIIANSVIIHAVTTNCAKFFHSVTLNDASDYYQERKQSR